MVFPNTPGANDEWDELDSVQRGVWEQVVKDCWNPTNPNFSGPVQRLVGERDDKLVLIKTKTTVGGKPSVDVVYLTALEELIFGGLEDREAFGVRSNPGVRSPPGPGVGPPGRENPARYEPVKPADVEETASNYRLKKKRTKKRRGSRNRLAELRTYEHGDYSEFYRVHRRVIELSDYVSHQLVKMAFWAAAPKDELARVVDELADLRDAIDAAIVCIKQRTDDDVLLDKIAKLENTQGRTEPEAATARALAAKLRSQYDQRVGVLD